MRADVQRLDDVLAAAVAIESHLARGTLADGLVFDEVRVRLIEIDEAVKDIDPAFLADERTCRGPTSTACGINWRTATSTPTTRS